MDLLRKLTQTPGTPGQERRIRELVKSELEPLVDEIRIDRLGNLIGLKKGNGGARIMLSAHMDQIGFMVSHIDDEGFIRFNPTGGFDPRTLMAQRVVVHGKEDLPGVMGSKPIHILSDEEKKKPLKISDFFVDLGLPGEKVKELVRVGDPVTWTGEFEEMGDMYLARAMDDRIGVYIMIEALRRIKNHDCDIFAVAAVQEEVGIRGAIASATEIKPEIGIALDITIANDTPGAKSYERVTEMGKGVAIKRMDSYSISSPPLVSHFEEIAEREKIPWQTEILPRGGTDAAAMWHIPGGAHLITLSIPCRYVHSTVELVHKDDVEAGIKLLVAYLEEAGNKDYY
ncbi:MAG: M42 family metallopeptidase [Candidatus Electryonea clarkiae]|nr:M42 family metallopeptidase [Candidatus Electryonea clarkiae]MDP8285838.1 M42 family metallopeptidase [Candidatus Electryonea clarkiae]